MKSCMRGSTFTFCVLFCFRRCKDLMPVREPSGQWKTSVVLLKCVSNGILKILCHWFITVTGIYFLTSLILWIRRRMTVEDSCLLRRYEVLKILEWRKSCCWATCLFFSTTQLNIRKLDFFFLFLAIRLCAPQILKCKTVPWVSGFVSFASYLFLLVESK